MILSYIIIALFIGSAGSVLLAGLLLLFHDDKLHIIATFLSTLAGGTLLGAAFLGMLPKATSLAAAGVVFKVTLAGIILFFLTEKIILWRICGNKDCVRHQNASSQLILVGDGFHNFIDGIIITASFYTSISFGVLVTLSVFAHEIPQELGDFGILIKNGFSKKKAIFYNVLSSFTTIIGGIITYFALDYARSMIPYVLAFSAASFIYIALADLVPQMHQKTSLRDSFIQLTLILTGVAIIYLLEKTQISVF
jgi:zinc and cadmium transporter